MLYLWKVGKSVLLLLLLLLPLAPLVGFLADHYPQARALHVLGQFVSDEFEVARSKIIFNRGSPCSNETEVIETVIGSVLLAQDAAMITPYDHRRDTRDYYMGRDSALFEDRILGNYEHVGAFLEPSNNRRIHVNCVEEGEKRPGLKPGEEVMATAYSMTSPDGVTCDHLNLTSAFFRRPGLATLGRDIIEDMRSRHPSRMRGTKRERDAEWQTTRESVLLHEMEHLVRPSGGVEPSIIDETMGDEGRGHRVYGPKLVYKLANRPKKKYGGATRASTNADSYAVLASAIW